MTQEKAAPKDFLGIRTKREALGMTLKDVFALTRISVVNLEAIENGDFHDLPVPIYTKNFIKTYAQALDLDSKPILDSYEAYLNSLTNRARHQYANRKLCRNRNKSLSLKSLLNIKLYIVVASVYNYCCRRWRHYFSTTATFADSYRQSAANYRVCSAGCSKHAALDSVGCSSG